MLVNTNNIEISVGLSYKVNKQLEQTQGALTQELFWKNVKADAKKLLVVSAEIMNEFKAERGGV